ncbi:MAG: 4Fe-4S dicluster domain-containing protein [Desulfovibrionaceae bacterium]|jgi:heterodisulfide reductase subunit C|nr:4Fe-4S dicluster domain-containing protein [Desulfovibrionaceae bacterium]
MSTRTTPPAGPGDLSRPNGPARPDDGARDKDFIAELRRLSGQNPARCIQCGKCTAGCPAAFAHDYGVSQILRLAQEGRKDALLSSRTIWLCLSCQTCATRCPMGIDTPALMDALRHMARAEGRVSERAVNSFHESFLDSARKHGRVHELGLMLDYVRRTGRVLTDVGLAGKVLALRKLSLRPHGIRGRAEVKDIVRRFEDDDAKGLTQPAPPKQGRARQGRAPR